MKTTGPLLKSRREELGMTLAEVSLATKITVRMLRAMEEGDTDKLPALTFLRGFVRTYASHLKMDPEKVLRAFNDDFAPPPTPVSSPATSATITPLEAPRPEPKVVSTDSDLLNEGTSIRQRAGWALGILALIGMIVFIGSLIEKYEREAQLEPTPPVTSLPSPEPEPVEPEKEKVAAPEPSPAPAPAPTPAPAPSPAPAPAAAPTVSATPPPAASATPPSTAAAATPKPAAPPAVATPPPPPKESPKPTDNVQVSATPQRQEVILEALDKVDISVKMPSGEMKKFSLAPDQVHTVRAVGPLSIDLSDGGVVNVIHNGKELGVLGDLGRPKKIDLP